METGSNRGELTPEARKFIKSIAKKTQSTKSEHRPFPLQQKKKKAGDRGGQGVKNGIAEVVANKKAENTAKSRETPQSTTPAATLQRGREAVASMTKQKSAQKRRDTEKQKRKTDMGEGRVTLTFVDQRLAQEMKNGGVQTPTSKSKTGQRRHTHTLVDTGISVDLPHGEEYYAVHNQPPHESGRSGNLLSHVKKSRYPFNSRGHHESETKAERLRKRGKRKRKINFEADRKREPNTATVRWREMA